LNHCQIRGKEWLKNIETLLSDKRAKGEGEHMADEIITYMQKYFMEGIR